MRLRELLATAGDLARHESERLLMAAAGMGRAELSSVDDVPPETVEAFTRLVAERRRGIPLQHLEGSVQFGPLELKCDSRALIPRPETEELWELAAGIAELPAIVVDLCTGGGALALALKHTHPKARVIGTDVSGEALSLAAENGELTGLAVEWRQGDLFDAVPKELRGRVDLVVSNPPYIATGDYYDLPREVRYHDPRLALVAGPEGTEVLGRIASEAKDWLVPGGLIICEIGADQADRAMELFERYRPEVRMDTAGRHRFVVGRV